MFRLVLSFALVLALIGGSRAQTRPPPPSGEARCEVDSPHRGHASDKVEPHCLTQLKGIATRSGDLLRLKLSNGQTKVFKDESAACKQGDANKCIAYRLVGYRSQTQAFILDVSIWEGGGFIVLSRRTGAIVKLEDRPHFSPSGKRFVAVASSEAITIDTAIVIFSADRDPPAMEWSYPTPKEYALYSFAGWDGEDQIKLSIYAKVGSDLKDVDAAAVRTDAGWTLKKPDGIP